MTSHATVAPARRAPHSACVARRLTVLVVVVVVVVVAGASGESSLNVGAGAALPLHIPGFLPSDGADQVGEPAFCVPPQHADTPNDEYYRAVCGETLEWSDELRLRLLAEAHHVAPIVYFHPLETVFPDSVERFLDAARIYDSQRNDLGSARDSLDSYLIDRSYVAVSPEQYAASEAEEEASPTPAPTSSPTPAPTSSPTPAPTSSPTPEPTSSPTPAPTTPAPTPMPGDAAAWAGLFFDALFRVFERVARFEFSSARLVDPLGWSSRTGVFLSAGMNFSTLAPIASPDDGCWGDNLTVCYYGHQGMPFVDVVGNDSDAHNATLYPFVYDNAYAFDAYRDGSSTQAAAPWLPAVPLPNTGGGGSDEPTPTPPTPTPVPTPPTPSTPQPSPEPTVEPALFRYPVRRRSTAPMYANVPTTTSNQTWGVANNYTVFVNFWMFFAAAGCRSETMQFTDSSFDYAYATTSTRCDLGAHEGQWRRVGVEVCRARPRVALIETDMGTRWEQRYACNSTARREVYQWMNTTARQQLGTLRNDGDSVARVRGTFENFTGVDLPSRTSASDGAWYVPINETDLTDNTTGYDDPQPCDLALDPALATTARPVVYVALNTHSLFNKPAYTMPLMQYQPAFVATIFGYGYAEAAIGSPDAVWLPASDGSNVVPMYSLFEYLEFFENGTTPGADSVDAEYHAHYVNETRWNMFAGLWGLSHLNGSRPSADVEYYTMNQTMVDGDAGVSYLGQGIAYFIWLLFGVEEYTLRPSVEAGGVPAPVMWFKYHWPAFPVVSLPPTFSYGLFCHNSSLLQPFTFIAFESVSKALDATTVVIGCLVLLIVVTLLLLLIFGGCCCRSSSGRTARRIYALLLRVPKMSIVGCTLAVIGVIFFARDLHVGVSHLTAMARGSTADAIDISLIVVFACVFTVIAIDLSFLITSIVADNAALADRVQQGAIKLRTLQSLNALSIVAMLLATLLTLFVFTLGIIVSILQLVLLLACRALPPLVLGSCLDLSLFGLDDVYCGDEIVEFCERFEEYSGVLIIIGIVFFSFGQSCLLVAAGINAALINNVVVHQRNRAIRARIAAQRARRCSAESASARSNEATALEKQQGTLSCCYFGSAPIEDDGAASERWSLLSLIDARRDADTGTRSHPDVVDTDDDDDHAVGDTNTRARTDDVELHEINEQ